jgi:hypothetical protein
MIGLSDANVIASDRWSSVLQARIETKEAKQSRERGDYHVAPLRHSQ